MGQAQKGKNMKKLAILLVLAFALPVTAQWKPIVESADGDLWYYQPGKITRSGNVRRAWLWTTLADDDVIDHFIAFQEVNCESWTERVAQSTTYYKDGTNHVRTTAERWRYITPSTVMDALARVICG